MGDTDVIVISLAGRGPDAADQEAAITRNVARAAVDAGVGHLVYTSVHRADETTGVPHFEVKGVLEAELAALGEVIAGDDNMAPGIPSVATVVEISTIGGEVLPLGHATALATTLSVEHAPSGVLTNAVLPGLTLTDRARRLIPQAARDDVATRTPTRRLADPRDTTHAVAFLGSPANQQITSQLLRVDGGL